MSVSAIRDLRVRFERYHSWERGQQRGPEPDFEMVNGTYRDPEVEQAWTMYSYRACSRAA